MSLNSDDRMLDIEGQLRKFVDTNLVYGKGDVLYDNDSSFIQEGLVDSMGVLEIIAYVQSAFGIEIGSREVTPQNFDSVNKIGQFVRGKLAYPAVTGEDNVGTGRARKH